MEQSAPSTSNLTKIGSAEAALEALGALLKTETLSPEGQDTIERLATYIKESDELLGEFYDASERERNLNENMFVPLSIRGLREHSQTAVVQTLGVAKFGLNKTEKILGIGSYPSKPVRFKNRRTLLIALVAQVLGKKTDDVWELMNKGTLTDLLLDEIEKLAKDQKKLLVDPQSVLIGNVAEKILHDTTAVVFEKYDANYTRKANEDYTNLVAQFGWNSFYEKLKQLWSASLPSDAEPAAGSFLLQDELRDLFEEYQNALNRRGEVLRGRGRDSVLQQLTLMLPGMLIIVDPELLVYTLTGTRDERDYANEVAHPGLKTVRNAFESVSEDFRDTMPKPSLILLDVLQSIEDDESMTPPQRLANGMQNLFMEVMDSIGEERGERE